MGAPFIEQPFEPEWFNTRVSDEAKTFTIDYFNAAVEYIKNAPPPPPPRLILSPRMAAWYEFFVRRNTPFPGVDFNAWLFPRFTRLERWVQRRVARLELWWRRRRPYGEDSW